MFPPAMGKSKWSFALSEIPYVYDFERSGIYGVPNQILRDTRTELFKAHKTGTVQGKRE
jgi:hypothetical protein